eukprot:g5414.t1
MTWQVIKLLSVSGLQSLEQETTFRARNHIGYSVGAFELGLESQLVDQPQRNKRPATPRKRKSKVEMVKKRYRKAHWSPRPRQSPDEPLQETKDSVVKIPLFDLQQIEKLLWGQKKGQGWYGDYYHDTVSPNARGQVEFGVTAS